MHVCLNFSVDICFRDYNIQKAPLNNNMHGAWLYNIRAKRDACLIK